MINRLPIILLALVAVVGAVRVDSTKQSGMANDMSRTMSRLHLRANQASEFKEAVGVQALAGEKGKEMTDVMEEPIVPDTPSTADTPVHDPADESESEIESESESTHDQLVSVQEIANEELNNMDPVQLLNQIKSSGARTIEELVQAAEEEVGNAFQDWPEGSVGQMWNVYGKSAIEAGLLENYALKMQNFEEPAAQAEFSRNIFEQAMAQFQATVIAADTYLENEVYDMVQQDINEGEINEGYTVSDATKVWTTTITTDPEWKERFSKAGTKFVTGPEGGFGSFEIVEYATKVEEEQEGGDFNLNPDATANNHAIQPENNAAGNGKLYNLGFSGEAIEIFADPAMRDFLVDPAASALDPGGIHLTEAANQFFDGTFGIFQADASNGLDESFTVIDATDGEEKRDNIIEANAELAVDFFDFTDGLDELEEEFEEMEENKEHEKK